MLLIGQQMSLIRIVPYSKYLSLQAQIVVVVHFHPQIIFNIFFVIVFLRFSISHHFWLLRWLIGLDMPARY